MNDAIQDAATPDEAPQSIWQQLRAAREAKGLSVSEVSAHLKLTVRQIEAIEQGDLSALPGRAFAKGFVKNYARFLGLDPAGFSTGLESREPVIAHDDAAQSLGQGLGEMPSARGRSFSILPALLVVLLLAAVLGAGWHYGWFEAREERALLASDPQPVAIGEQSAIVLAAPEASAPASAESAPLAGASEPAVAPLDVSSTVSAPVAVTQSAPAAVLEAPTPGASTVPAGMVRMVLNFSGASWVEVRDGSNKVVFSRLNQAGAVQEVQATPPLSLIIGNAPNVKLSWRGEAVDLAPLTRGEVARVNLK